MNDHRPALALYLAIVNDGDARRVIELSHQTGVQGATVFYGYGTMNRGFMAMIGLSDIKKEIVLMCSDTVSGDAAAKLIYESLQMRKPHHGVIVSLDIESLFGSASLTPLSHQEKKEAPMENQAIFTIVDKGKSELVIDAAASAGATGGTIIYARGSGIHETKKIFNIPIEPEKEIVLTIAPTDKVETITTAIRKELRIDDPGMGIVFVMDVRSDYGLYKGK